MSVDSVLPAPRASSPAPGSPRWAAAGAGARPAQFATWPWNGFTGAALAQRRARPSGSRALCRAPANACQALHASGPNITATSAPRFLCPRGG